ncbi:MAG: DUF4140 domain-containing protein, partial [Pontiellaceae bacterium]|nr:DUF4140 domain-containing protein [Pontiellaceae bacterium]
MITMFAIAAMAVSSHVSEVTVYNDRAQVVRTAEAELSAGFNTIVFENLPEAVDARGIQVDGAGAATVLDVRFKTENLEQVDDATWQVLFNRRDNLQAEQRRLNQKIERLNAAKVFLGNIRSSVTHTPREGAAPELDPARWEA